ncbi:hypothetical protein GCM10027040_24150 [Halomonas shantousis]
MKYAIPDFPSQPCYQLSDATLIGRGNKRDCHAHPTNPELCIKVARHPERWRECQEQNIVEWHYTNHLKQSGVPLDHAADCYGWVNTNYGAGLIMKRIREADGSSALTLRKALIKDRIDIKDTKLMLAELKRWAFQHAVVIADLNTDNLMVENHNGKLNFVFIDGLGSRKADRKFTLYQRFPSIARLKTYRQWKRQEKTLFRTVNSLKSHSEDIENAGYK